MTAIPPTSGPDLFGAVPAETMRRGANISQCGKYRYTLTRKWNCGQGRVCWIMLNPSTADALQDDPTIRRCIRFSQSWGAQELVVVNLYPYRSSSPEECRRWADWESAGPDWYVRDQIHFVNQPVIEQQAEAADLVVAAWGAAEWASAWAQHVIDELLFPCKPIYCLGTTKHGAPLHPMARGKNRVPDDRWPRVWRDAV